ncbi:hypothetical protein F4774DRAFT_367708 [Daldinia eschscholtzii]|nr:hypothetical protein F4774DRAFT_367708 [Daldinia eschscholtzii]
MNVRLFSFERFTRRLVPRSTRSMTPRPGVAGSRHVVRIASASHPHLSQTVRIRPSRENTVAQIVKRSSFAPKSFGVRYGAQVPWGLAAFHSNPAMTDGDAILAAMADPLDGIDESLRDENHNTDAPWGMAVYRVCYDDDAAWQQMLARIEETVQWRLKLVGRSDLRARHKLVVMDDPSKFSGMKPDEIREIFTEWAAEEHRRNWGGKHNNKDPYFSGARYNFCLVVDDLCLESLDKGAIAPVIKILQKDFSPWTEEEAREMGFIGEVDGDSELPAGFWEGGVTGSEEENVGWMYIPVVEYVEQCNILCDADNWHDSYVRPPFTFYDRTVENRVGYWRTVVEKSPGSNSKQ